MLKKYDVVTLCSVSVISFAIGILPFLHPKINSSHDRPLYISLSYYKYEASFYKLTNDYRYLDSLINSKQFTDFNSERDLVLEDINNQRKALDQLVTYLPSAKSSVIDYEDQLDNVANDLTVISPNLDFDSYVAFLNELDGLLTQRAILTRNFETILSKEYNTPIAH